MNKLEIVEVFENFAPLELQEKWDCSGWIVNTEKRNIHRILLALTVTDKIYEQALKHKCDMIISHHPLFFVPLKYKNLDIYCSHTNTDKTLGGTTDTVIELLNLKTSTIEAEFLRIVEPESPVLVETFAQKLKDVFKNVRLINNNDIKKLKRIGFCAGSGTDFLNLAEGLNLDGFVTGDIKYHTAVDSQTVLFDIGHFESEFPILKVFKNLLKGKKVEVLIADEKTPFKNI